MVHEWSVMLTDVILALACFDLQRRAIRGVPRDQESSYTVTAAIGLVGLAALIGSIRHGWGPDLSLESYQVLWTSGYLFIMISGNLLVWGCIRGSCLKETHGLWMGICTSRLVLTCTPFLLVRDTFFVAADWVLTMLMLAVVAVRIWQLGKHELGRDIGIGVTVSIIAGCIQQGVFFGTRSHLHDDLCHIIMIPAMYAFMLVARRIRDTG